MTESAVSWEKKRMFDIADTVQALGNSEKEKRNY